MKTCSKCGEEKPLEEFNLKDPKNYPILRRRDCKRCQSEYLLGYREGNREIIKTQKADAYLLNRSEIRAQQNQSRKENPEKTKKQKAESYVRHRDKIRVQHKVYYRNNTGKIKAAVKKYSKERFKLDPAFRMECNLRARMRIALKGNIRSGKTFELIGGTSQELRFHIASQFSDGMSWDNCGQWHVDHIIPCAFFDLLRIDHQFMCFNWRNIQPMWGSENMKKHASPCQRSLEKLKNFLNTGNPNWDENGVRITFLLIEMAQAFLKEAS
jgi:hypothetical protein